MDAKTANNNRMVAGVMVDTRNQCAYCHGKGCHVCGSVEVANVLATLAINPDFYDSPPKAEYDTGIFSLTGRKDPDVYHCPRCGHEVGEQYDTCPGCNVRRPPEQNQVRFTAWSKEALGELSLHIVELVETDRFQESEVLAMWNACFDSLMKTGHFERDGAALALAGVGITYPKGITH